MMPSGSLVLRSFTSVYLSGAGAFGEIVGRDANGCDTPCFTG
jgi:hypothetical protein